MNSDDPTGSSDRTLSRKDRSRQMWEQKQQLKTKWLQGAELRSGHRGEPITRAHSIRETVCSDPYEIDLEADSCLEGVSVTE
jgi:hypothetical protein